MQQYSHRRLGGSCTLELPTAGEYERGEVFVKVKNTKELNRTVAQRTSAANRVIVRPALGRAARLFRSETKGTTIAD